MVYNYIGKGSVKTHLYSLNTQHFLNQLMVKNTTLILMLKYQFGRMKSRLKC